MKDINWTGDPHDLTAHYNGHVLRIEQLDRAYWWWAVDDIDGTCQTVEKCKEEIIKVLEDGKI